MDVQMPMPKCRMPPKTEQSDALAAQLLDMLRQAGSVCEEESQQPHCGQPAATATTSTTPAQRHRARVLKDRKKKNRKKALHKKQQKAKRKLQ
jgi:hypothetical protein